MSTRKERAARRAGEFPPPPEPLAVPVFDSHTHLDITIEETGTESVDSLLAAAAKVGVDRVVQVGVDVPSSRWGAALAARDDRVLAAVALHPNDAPRVDDLDEALRQIERSEERRVGKGCRA